MIVHTQVPPTPTRLSHHTHLKKTIYKILKNKDDSGISLLVRSNMKKNDPNEILMGEKLFQKVIECFGTHASLLKQIHNYKQSASCSFIEGESSTYMIKKYGTYRLDFDLCDIVSELHPYDKFIQCEYYSEQEFSEFINEYCTFVSYLLQNIFTGNEQFGQASSTFVIPLTYIEQDIMCKLFAIKDIQWSEEKEWRLVYPLEDDKTEFKIHLPKKVLTGIVIYSKHPEDKRVLQTQNELQYLLDRNNYTATVSIKQF